MVLGPERTRGLGERPGSTRDHFRLERVDPRSCGHAGAASYEGIDILPILEGAPKQERTFFWRSAPNANRTRQAARHDDGTLLVDANRLLLYNLREDIGERQIAHRKGLTSPMRKL